MRARGARGLRAIAFGLFVVLALRPVPALERGLDWLLAPARIFCELAAPVGWLRAGDARASEEALAAVAEAESREGEALLADLRRAAEPPRGELREGRRVLVGEVVGRAAGDLDRVRVALTDLRGVVEGLPVVNGASWVGRVAAVDRARGEAWVELVTGRGGWVGARVERAAGAAGPDALLTVGGLRAKRRGDGAREAFLAAHNPNDRRVGSGRVVVHELLPEVEPFGRLAEGYALGELERLDGEWIVHPALDYRDGLFWVAVLAPEDPSLPPAAPPRPALADGRWRRARVLAHADASPWRRGLAVGAGSLSGIEEGAAVVAGARLVGRVLRAGPIASQVATLADPGLELVAVARVEGEEDPLVLGRLASLGRDPRTGAIVFRRGTVLRADELEGVRAASVFTGSGLAGLPGGLYVGEAAIDASDPSLVHVRPAAEGERLSRVWVRGGAGGEAWTEPAERAP